jgi:2'-5' RNA ligase
MLTVGVAIPVAEPYGSDLRRYRASFGDIQAESVPTHVTLLPPTIVESVALQEIDEHLTKVASAHPRFVMHLRGTATFRPNSPVVFISLTKGISACELLSEAIRTGPLERELPFPYHPHVTVAQDVPDAALDRAYESLADYECRFDVAAFAMYTHEDGRGWVPRREFPLGDVVTMT